jgi:hypothetical protein
MPKIKLILTFDYELPLGGCTSYQKGIFEPTDALIKLANAKKIKVILFADICSAMMFKKWNYKGYYQPFVDQIKTALSSNHEVQLHIHPHWLNSKYENGQFYPSNAKILSKFRNEEYPHNIQGIIESSARELNEICSSKANSECIAYRGGGFNLQPDTDIILSNLYKNGIRYDSSIIKGYYFKSDIQEEDFRKMPKKANWIIPLEGPLNFTAKEGIMEIPIASMPAKPYYRLSRIYKKIINKKLYNSLKHNHGGTGHVGNKPDFTGRINSFIYSPFTLSFDYLYQDLSILDKIIKYQLKVYKEEKEITLSLISHPKALGSYHLQQMDKFIDLIRTRYKDSIEICGYRDL